MPKKNDKGVILLSALEEDISTTLMGKRELYGLELLDEINKARNKEGINKLGIGSLYPTLKRMEKAGLINGEFRESVVGENSPRRKYYKLSSNGQIAISRTRTYRDLLAKKNETSNTEEKFA